MVYTKFLMRTVMWLEAFGFCQEEEMIQNDMQKSHILLKVEVRSINSGLCCLDLNHDIPFISFETSVTWNLSLNLCHLYSGSNIIQTRNIKQSRTQMNYIYMFVEWIYARHHSMHFHVLSCLNHAKICLNRYSFSLIQSGGIWTLKFSKL